MATTWLNFENKTDAATCTVTGTNADVVSITSGTMVWDDADYTIPAAYNVVWSAIITASATAGVDYFQKNFTSTTSLSTSIAFDIATLTSSGGLAMIWVGLDGSTRSFTVGLETTGKIAVQNAAGTLVYTAPSAISTGVGRIEVTATAGTTTGSLRIRYYTGSSTTATLDTTITNQAFTATFGSVRWGKAATGSYAGTLRIWACGMSDTGATLGFPPVAGTAPAMVSATANDSTICLVYLNFTPVAPDTALSYTLTGANATVNLGNGYFYTTRPTSGSSSYAYTVTGNNSLLVSSGSVSVAAAAAAATPAGMIEELINDGTF
jgi:hypothetical protein